MRQSRRENEKYDAKKIRVVLIRNYDFKKRPIVFFFQFFSTISSVVEHRIQCQPTRGAQLSCDTHDGVIGVIVVGVIVVGVLVARAVLGKPVDTRTRYFVLNTKYKRSQVRSSWKKYRYCLSSSGDQDSRASENPDVSAPCTRAM